MTGKIFTYFGVIELCLFSESAPITVMNFKKLTDQGFYDGLLFHRIIPNFLIQAGDPSTRYPQSRSMWGRGDPGWSIPGESTEYRQIRGAVAMAALPRSNRPGSQFVIILGSLESFSGCSTIFGQVASGMEVVDKIAAVRTDASDAPIDIEQAKISKVTVSVSI